MKTFFNILLVAILSVGSLNAQTTNEKIDSLLNDFYNKGMFNGSALVSVNGKIIYKKGFGYANFEWNIQNDTDTKFKIGSCSKQFTAALIMILKEEGKIKLEGKISDYIPDYPSEKGNKITIHYLLSHTSGIPEYLAIPGIDSLLFKDNNPNEFMKKFWNLELEFEPGSELKYSNSGYFVLGVIIERITGQSYSQVLKDKIFDSLEMSNSGTISDSVILKNKAYAYVKVNDSLIVAPYFNATAAFSAGIIYSTVEDLFKWQIALESNSILSKEQLTFHDMVTDLEY
jgi:CubicO group peptidase (beta-lactamase class C family)